MFIKYAPGDFQVRELLEFEEDPQGAFYVHVLKKEKIDTQDALGVVSREARVPRGDIAFAGLKDRQGRTEQFISIKGRRVDLRLPDVQVFFKGRAARPIHSKQSQGNRFRITLRGLERDTAETLVERLPTLAQTGYVNYFDDQRFGSIRHGQGLPMRDVLAGRYEKALERMIARPSPVAKGGDTKLKQLLKQHWGDWDVCAKIARGPVYRPVLEHLARNPADFAGAIGKLNQRTRLIHAFAYQSYLWNRAVSSLLEEIVPPSGRVSIDSLMGDLTTFVRLDGDTARDLREMKTPLYAPDGDGGDPRFEDQVLRWLTSEQLTPKHCRDNSLPGMVWREEPRDLLVFPRDVEAPRSGRDEKHRGASKVEMSFSLPRGVYATMLIKHLFAGLDDGGGKRKSKRNS